MTFQSCAAVIAKANARALTATQVEHFLEEHGLAGEPEKNQHAPSIDLERVWELIRILRSRAEPVGPLHSAWDLIFDLEAVVEGRETLLRKTPEEIIALAESRV